MKRPLNIMLDRDSGDCTLIVDANGDVVADCGILGRSAAENVRTAALIVRVLNAYEGHVREIARLKVAAGEVPPS